MIEIEKWCQYKRCKPVIMSEEERKLQETSHDHFKTSPYCRTFNFFGHKIMNTRIGRLRSHIQIYILILEIFQQIFPPFLVRKIF